MLDLDGSKCNHKSPYKRRGEGDLITEEDAVRQKQHAFLLALEMEEGPLTT